MIGHDCSDNSGETAARVRYPVERHLPYGEIASLSCNAARNTGQFVIACGEIASLSCRLKK
jgi:hypothetical protein